MGLQGGFPETLETYRAYAPADKKKRTSVHCKLCPKVLKHSGCTTNLRYHLKLSHKTQFDLLNKPKERNQSSGTNQATIDVLFEKATPMERSSPRWNDLTHSVCYFLAKDMQPIDTVNDLGFRTMLKKFEPRYVPPDRKTLSTNYLPRLYQAETDRVKKALSPVTSYACTTVMWTSRAKHAYISLTVHYLDEDYALCNNLLAVKEFPESHIGSNIADELESIITEWKLSLNNLTSFTTDNGSNVANAIDMMGHIRVPCISHCLNLAVEKACSISEVTKALARCRRLVSHFNHSSKSSYLLKQKQESLSHPTHSLLQDVSTRWNSAYYMVARVIEQQQPVCATLLELKKKQISCHLIMNFKQWKHM